MNEDQGGGAKTMPPENLALLRRLAFNLIRKTKSAKQSVRASLKKTGSNNSFLEAILVAR